MARAKYYIKKQVEGEEIEELADFTRKDKAERFLNGKNSLGTVDSHIEDYRTKERMEEEFSRIKETFRNNPHTEMMEEGDRHFKVKVGRVTFEYYITEREI